jgi:hypothetical protein
MLYPLILNSLRANLTSTEALIGAFRLVTDRHGKGPFEVERREKGFLIRSALNDDGKPQVTLAIGEAD